MKALIGKKIGMTQVYDEKGVLIPVTVIEAGPCVVTAVKTVERDGYAALQLGFGARKAKNLSRAEKGHLTKAVAVDADTLEPVKKLGPNTLLAVAAYVGKTRLIDNHLL